jgi:hypothetical protein
MKQATQLRLIVPCDAPFNYSNLFDPFLTEVTLIIMGNLDISASKENPEGHANLRFFFAAAIVLTWLWKNSG